MTSLKCIICDSPCDYFFSKEYTSFPISEYMRSIGPVEYFRCNDCGFVFSKTHRDITKAQWDELNIKFHHYNETEDSARKNMNQPPYAEQAFMIAMLRANGIIQPDGMLDYAAGYGTLTNLMKKLFHVELPIYDPYIQSGDLSRYVDDPIPRSYKTVINSAFFEHVLSRADLDSVNSMVADDGCLILHTVICENIPRDPEWFYLRPPVHTAFHTNKSMNILMEQWGYRSSLYCPQSKCWTLFRVPFCEIRDEMEKINRELQTKWLYGKTGFMDYWKGF